MLSTLLSQTIVVGIIQIKCISNICGCFVKIFDPTIKKKNKKKKVFDLEAAIGAAHEEGDPMDTSTTPDKENMEPSANSNDVDGKRLRFFIKCNNLEFFNC